MSQTPSELLRRWLQRQLPAGAGAWLDEQLRELAAAPAERQLHITLGMIPRRLGKADLELDEDDLAAAEQARPGWRPQGWSVDSAARVLALCSSAPGANPGFAGRFTELCRYADVAEQIALYRGLPLYPEPQRLEAQAAEGVRSNMRAVFEAVAHHNPYPREQFDDKRWNQMVLKALFVDSRLAPIQGLDRRANPELARILCDYAHERWAAGRAVSPELWRCVGPFADGVMLDDLARALAGSPREREAAALALAASPAPRAAELLAGSGMAAAVSSGELSWRNVAEAAQHP